VTLYDLTSAYGVLANRGIRTDPLYVLKVEDKNGTVLEKNAPHPVEVLSEETASVVTSMLQSAMDHGTGYPARARGFTNPAAGKTGTMDDYMDAWFVGYTPSLACGVWVGYDQKRTIGAGMTGARAALPAWTDFMIGATRGRPVEDFPLPAGTVSREICAETGMLATTACTSVTTEMFTDGSEPTELCTQHPGPPLEPALPGTLPPGPRRGDATDTERPPGEPALQN
jgi:penicillin-binding protein 1A